MTLSLFLVALVVCAALAIAEPRQTRWLHVFFTVLIFLPATWLVHFGLAKMSGAPAVRYDQYFFLVSSYFGLPSFFLGRLLAIHPWLHAVALWDYNLVMDAALVAICVCHYGLGPKDGYRALLAFVLNPSLGVLCYALLPASGPIFAFSGFPYSLPAIATPHAVLLSAPPNCFPSCHLSAALLVFYFMSRWRIGRWIGGTHVALTVLATLGLGEHYVIDLIASVPYTAVIVCLTSPRSNTRRYGATSFAHDAPRISVVPHAHKLDVADMVRIHPFEEIEIGNEFGLHPDALFHLRGGEPRYPTGRSAPREDS